MIRRILAVALAAAGASTWMAPAASAAPTTIDFEQFAPVAEPFFEVADSPLTVGIVTFTGGQLLSQTSALPADRSTVYGTAFVCTGCERELRLSFSEAVSDFRVLVLNGVNQTLAYTVTTAGGTTSTRVLAPNVESGAQEFTLPDASITSVTIRPAALSDQWDFLIDDVRFSPARPTSKDQCKNGGYAAFGFANQGHCVAFVQRGPKP